MGLIKAFSGAFRSELADQWKEYLFVTVWLRRRCCS